MKELRAAALILGLAILVITPNIHAGSITVFNVVDYGAVPNDSTDDTAAVTGAVNACNGSDTKTLYFPGGKFNLKTITFPASINVVMADGALLEIESGATVTFHGPFTAGLYRVFSGPGTVQFGGPGSDSPVPEVYPQWWYTPGDPDASPAINKAIDSSHDTGWVPGINIRLSGTFHCKTTIHVNRNRVTIIGDGMYATKLIFDPAAGGLPLIEFKKAADSADLTSWQCAIRDMALYGAAGNTRQKIGIKIVNVSVLEVRNISIQDWWGGGSIGLQTQGREFSFMENISVAADLPVSIENNPYLDWIDIDHFTFRNMYLKAKDINGANVQIASGVTLSNVQFEGTNAWVGGKYGLLWDDTTSAGVSENLSVRNVRMEGSAAPGGDIIHINHNYTLDNLVLENISGGSGGVGGIFLRKCFPVTLKNIFYTAGGYAPAPTALDIDESSSNIVLINAFWNDGLVKTGALIKTFGTNSNPLRTGGSDNRLIEVYDRPNNPQGEGLLLYGTRTWCYSGELANNAALSLPVGSGNTKVATITVSATDGAGNTHDASGYFMVGAGGATILVVGTPNTDTNSTEGKLCLVGGSTVRLINYLGAKVNVVITLFWRGKDAREGR